MKSLLIYGCNGYTGRLIAQRAKARGLEPILAGRNREQVEALGATLKLNTRVFDLGDSVAVERGLDGVGVVLHCAGPFSVTSAPMISACLKVRAHYLDITGEISVFAYAHSLDAAARKRGVVLCPGVGFDVVPTDCLAALLKATLPSATTLTLAFEAAGGPSPGTAKSSLEGVASGGRIRRDGKLVSVPSAYKVRDIPFASGPRRAVTIPWGDVYTATVSTGIPNVEVYMSMPPKAIARLRQLRFLAPLLKFDIVQSLLRAQISKRVAGPSARGRERSQSLVWGEATDAAGQRAVGELTAPNGYDLTADAAVKISELVMAQGGGIDPKNRHGYQTPSQLVGMGFLQALDGVTVSTPRLIKSPAL